MKTKIIGMLIALMFCCGCVSEAKYDLTPEENAWLQQHPTIKIGVSTDWSPYEFIDSTQRYTGIIGDFFKENCQLLGIKFQIDTLSTSWDTTLTLIAQKQIDVLPGVVYLPERDRYLLFTQSYLEATFVIVTVGDRHGSERVTTLNGKTVACQQGWATGNYVQELFPQARLTQKMNVDEIVADLLIGKADVAVIDINTFKYLREQRHMELLSICSDITFQIKVATGIRNDWPELVSILNKVYRQNSQTMLNEIKGRWMPDISYQHERYRKKMFIAGCIVMVLIIASLIVIFRLSIVNSIKSKLIARQRDESISQGNKYMLLENIFASSFKTSIHAELILKNGHIIAFNQKALETFGVSETEILGKQMLDFSPEYQPDGAKSTDQFERLWGNIAENEQLTFDWMCMTYSQSATFSAEVHLTRFVYDGKTYNTIVIKDVTQEREVQRELMGYRQHLEKMVADKTNELENANKHLQSLNTELDTANEELATSNAELLQIKERLEQANEALSLEVDKHF
ncbi:transporter substrate-binding domain-containing protein [Breznakibacter xylanolyticus]|nr:transporter substrate-binding domain-containing protein [Breznakibacter xylanolyticus]